ILRIRNRGRRAHEQGIAAVMPADSSQATKNVAQMTAEHAAIRVQLVDDHVAQILEELRPARLMRQDTRVHHVRVAEHDVRAPAWWVEGCGRRRDARAARSLASTASGNGANGASIAGRRRSAVT